MIFKEFGTISAPTIVLLHEGGLSWWSLMETIELLKKDYHIVAPIIDGHGEDAQTTFLSIQDSARKLIQYIDENNNGSVFAMGGSTLGAQIVVEALSQRTDIARYAIIESPWVIPSKSLTFLTVLAGRLAYRLYHWKWFARIRARELSIKKQHFIEYFSDTSSMTIIGSREIKRMDPSIHKLIDMIPETKVFIVPGMKPGEFSMIHSTEYYYLLKRITG